MAEATSPDPSVEFARGLIARSNPAEILRHACREAVRITGSPLCLGSHAPPRQPWSRRTNVIVPDGIVTPALSSALFALHRRIASTRTSSTIRRGPGSEPVFEALDALATGSTPAHLHLVPIVHRTGRLVGEIVLATHDPGLAGQWASELRDVALLTSAALENAQRLAFSKRDQERLNLLAEASEEALWDWDVDTLEFWWGGGVERMLGSDAVNVSHTIDWKFGRIHPDDVERVRDSFQRALDAPSRTSWSEEYRCRGGSDGSIDVEDRAHILRDSRGRPYRVVGALRDVSRLRRLLEREREARLEAETASRAKDDFLAMLGHELRNPLAPILTAATLLRLQGHQGIERERSVIERQARHMARLVDDLLDVSRIASGKIELQKERVELADVIARSVEMVRPMLEERRQQLDVDVPRDGLALDADPARLAQVFGNLLANAAKYGGTGGRIRVRAARSGGSIEASVADEGIGIEPDMLGRIFDMFVQERQALDRSRGGLGLGLSIARSVVVLHGGRIEARSEGRGLGSEFTVTLPAAEGAASDERRASRTRSATHLPLERIRVLVVDDNQDAAELLADYLSTLGAAAATAGDGREAIEAVTRSAPDVVLLDIGLPVLDGYEVARRLRSLPGGRSLRLVALTGYGQQADRHRSLEAGFDDHLVKPVSLERLERTIVELTRDLAAATG